MKAFTTTSLLITVLTAAAMLVLTSTTNQVFVVGANYSTTQAKTLSHTFPADGVETLTVPEPLTASKSRSEAAGAHGAVGLTLTRSISNPQRAGTPPPMPESSLTRPMTLPVTLPVTLSQSLDVPPVPHVPQLTMTLPRTLSQSVDVPPMPQLTMTRDLPPVASMTVEQSHSMSQLPLPPTPASPATTMPCSSLIVGANCFWNDTCTAFNGSTCAPFCEWISNDQNLCQSQPQCSWIASSRNCATKCSLFNNDPRGCSVTAGCVFLEGICYRACTGITNQTSCNLQSTLCMWNAGKAKCKPKCGLANDADAFLCEHVVAGTVQDECSWHVDRSSKSKTCVNKCSDIPAVDCVKVGAGRCIASLAGKCISDCSQATDGPTCMNQEYGPDCQWTGNKCRPTCDHAASNASFCSSWPGCTIVPGNPLACHAFKCDAYTTFDACMNRHTSGSCEWVDGKCKMACGVYALFDQTCPGLPRCSLSATSASCVAADCSVATAEADCVGRNECAWTNPGVCKSACHLSQDEVTCKARTDCWWRYGRLPVTRGAFTCVPKCASFPSQNACMSSHLAGREPVCAYDSATSSCLPLCSLYQWNNTLCSAQPSCEWSTVGKTCIPKCRGATTEAACKSAHYSFGASCFWDVRGGTCRKACEFETASTCAVPCGNSAKFQMCTMMNSPPPSLERTISLSRTLVNNNAGGSTTSTAAAAVASTAVASSTTSTPSSPPTTTAARRGNPRVEFVMQPGANSTGNVTVATFKIRLAAQLGIAASSLSVSISAAGTVIVEFTGDNAAAEFTAASGLNTTELASLGAADVTSIAPATTAAQQPAPEDDKLPMIIGLAVGGFVLLLIVLVVAKKASSGGTGSTYVEEERPGDSPMLQIPHTRAGVPQL